MVALGISAVAMYAVRNSERGRVMMPLLAYPALAALDLWAIYWELKSVELRVFNKERAEMVAEGWLATGRVPHAREVGHGAERGYACCRAARLGRQGQVGTL